MSESIVPQPGKKATAREKSCPPFAPVPKSLMSKKDVSQSAKLLYGLILSMSAERGYCYAGDAALAEGIGVERRQVQRALCELEEGRYVMITGATNRRHIRPLYETAIVSKAKRADRLAPETAETAPELAPLLTDETPELAPSEPKTCAAFDAHKRVLEEKIKEKEETTAEPTPQPHTQPGQAATASGVFALKGKEKKERTPLTREHIRASRALLPPAMREALERKEAAQQKEAAR